MFLHAYLRASGLDQNALRAKQSLIDFASGYDMKISSFHVENASGTSLDRKVLWKMIDDANHGDCILVEAVDRLSRLKREEWDKLKKAMGKKCLNIVSLDLPTSFLIFNKNKQDGFTETMFVAINAMMLDVLAAIACKDNETRAFRRDQGIKRAQELTPEKYSGRPADKERQQTIIKLRDGGLSIRGIAETLKCSPSTVQRAIKQQA